MFPTVSGGSSREARRRLRSTERMLIRAPRALVGVGAPRLDMLPPRCRGRHELPNKRLQLSGAPQSGSPSHASSGPRWIVEFGMRGHSARS